MHQLKILSLDGGGIKGIIPCTILDYIEKKTDTPISELFHVIAGTSTGGIIALGLTMPAVPGPGNAFSAEKMLQLYVEHGKDIFSARPKDWKSRIDGIVEEGIMDNAYDVTPFEKILIGKFGTSQLKDSLSNVLVTTYSPKYQKPFYFISRLAKKDAHENFLLWKIARSTSAAPTFFKPSKVNYQGDDNVAFVDGGVFANNPSILAYAEAKEIWKLDDRFKNARENAKAFDAKPTPDDYDLPFYMLSIGCGHSPTAIEYDKADKWRTKDWIKPLLTNVFMQGVAESTNYTMQYLLPPFQDGTRRYDRLDLGIPEKNSQMDDSSDDNIKELQAIADNYVKENKKKLDEICKLLTS